MPKLVTDAMKTLLGEPSAHLIFICSIRRKTKSTLYLTDSDQDIEYNAIVYRSSNGLQVSDVSESALLEGQSANLVLFETANTPFQKDLDAGEFSDSAVTIHIVDRNNLGAGALSYFTGYVSTKQIDSTGLMQLECVSESARVRTLGGETFSSTCRNRFGDTNCGINLTAHRFPVAVITASSRRNSFTVPLATADTYLNVGSITFTTGPNAGLTFDVRGYDHTTGTVKLWLKTPYPISPGETLFFYRGCPKILSLCHSFYNNAKNFRGEPYMPPKGMAKRKKPPEGKPVTKKRPKNPCGNPFITG